jgi:hypothetical protein
MLVDRLSFISCIYLKLDQAQELLASILSNSHRIALANEYNCYKELKLNGNAVIKQMSGGPG